MRIAAPFRNTLVGALLLVVPQVADGQYPAAATTGPTNAPAGNRQLADPAPVYQPQAYQSLSSTNYTTAARPVPAPTTGPGFPTYTPWVASRQPVLPSPAPPIPMVESVPPTVATPVPSMPPLPTAAPYQTTTTLPGYGSSGAPSYMQPAPPTYGEMPTATYDRQTFPPYGANTSPPKYSACMPTYSRPLFGHGHGGLGHCGPHGGFCNEYDPCCDPTGTACYGGCGDFSNWYDNIFAFTEVNAFKGGLDLDGLNGNFGGRVGVQGAIPVMRTWGLGVQFGGSAGWYDWKGTQYTGDGYRYQNFATLGVFQRFCSTGFGYAVAYDWLKDDYYHNFSFGQWRIAASWQWNACNEIGAWLAMPDRRDEAYVGTPAVRNDFSSVIQGNLYWRHVWSCAASTTIFAGVAENPSDIPLGASGQVAVNNYMAFTGGFEYILPSSGGNLGREEEVWAVSVGVAFYPGSAMRVTQSQFRPFLPLADNGNFAIRRN